jgi:hypothetical protein
LTFRVSHLSFTQFQIRFHNHSISHDCETWFCHSLSVSLIWSCNWWHFSRRCRLTFLITSCYPSIMTTTTTLHPSFLAGLLSIKNTLDEDKYSRDASSMISFHPWCVFGDKYFTFCVVTQESRADTQGQRLFVLNFLTLCLTSLSGSHGRWRIHAKKCIHDLASNIFSKSDQSKLCKQSDVCVNEVFGQCSHAVHLVYQMLQFR